MTIDYCETLSPHEQRLQDRMEGKEDRNRRAHSRAFTILESFEGTRPNIDIERALYFTQSFKQTEGQPLVLRWAKALAHIAANITVYIDDHQLLAGRVGRPGRYGILYPELDGDFLDRAVSELPLRIGAPFGIAEADAAIVVDEIAPYWKGKTYHEALNAALPPDVHKLTYDDPEGLVSRFIVNETSSFRSSIQWVHDYEKVLKRGFGGLRREALERLAALDPLSPRDEAEKKPFLEAMVIVSDAIVLWARRHAVLARQRAAEEPEAIRRQELLSLAEICERVPEHPAANFYEAV